MTRDEAKGIRRALTSLIVKIVDIPAEINENMVAILPWKPGVFNINDVRKYENIPYKCCQNHDSTLNTNWTPNLTPALWIQYHGTSKETARPWIAPTGAHDIYKAGEYMIWTDGNVYECISNTNFDPTVLPSAWSVCQ